VFTDNGTSVEFNGVTDNTTNPAISLQESGTVLSTDSNDANATATIVFDLEGDSSNGDSFDVNQFDAGTTVDVVITTASGTQAETSFIIESPLDPQLSPGDEVRLG
jgi:hypothetical protein